jgi:sec-independent protein translocase protein TatA
MPDLGPIEIVLVLVVVALLFGGNRIAEVGGALGKGVRDFRKSIRDEDEPEKTGSDITEAIGPETCARCGTVNVRGARYCADCGSAL